MKGEGGGEGGGGPTARLGVGGGGVWGGLGVFGALLGQQGRGAAMGAKQTQIGMLWIQNSPKRAQFGPF